MSLSLSLSRSLSLSLSLSLPLPLSPSPSLSLALFLSPLAVSAGLLLSLCYCAMRSYEAALPEQSVTNFNGDGVNTHILKNVL